MTQFLIENVKNRSLLLLLSLSRQRSSKRPFKWNTTLVPAYIHTSQTKQSTNNLARGKGSMLNDDSIMIGSRSHHVGTFIFFWLHSYLCYLTCRSKQRRQTALLGLDQMKEEPCSCNLTPSDIIWVSNVGKFHLVLFQSD